MTKKIIAPKTEKEAFAEAEEYFNNAKEILKTIPIEWDAYTKPKFVKEASAMGYLAGIRAIDGYLLSTGISPDKLPASITEYEKALKKIPHNGKLMTALNILYQNLHIFGYYRGGVSVDMIKAGFKSAKLIIDTLAKERKNGY